MEITWHIHLYRQKPDYPQDGGVPADVFEKIRARMPHLLNPSGRSMTLQVGDGDPNITEFLGAIRSEGVSIPADRSVHPPPLFINKVREYTIEEIEAAELLEPGAVDPIADMFRSPEGDVILESNNLLLEPNEFGRLDPYPNFLGTRGEIRNRFAEAGLVGLSFKPLQAKGNSPPSGYNPIELMWSDIVLPPIKNQLFDNRGNVFSSTENHGPFQWGCHPLDEHYLVAELHYDAASLERVGPFDVALTYERFGNREPCWRTPIVSQRFRRVCEELKLKMGWTPVRVDRA